MTSSKIYNLCLAARTFERVVIMQIAVLSVAGLAQELTKHAELAGWCITGAMLRRSIRLT